MTLSKMPEISRLPDFSESAGGFQAMHRPDVAPMAYYLTVICASWKHLTPQLIPEFLEGANQQLFEEIFRVTNGVRVGGNKFSTFGFLVGDQSVGVPRSIELPNLDLYGKPERTLIVGQSTEISDSGRKYEAFHTVMSDCEIRVALKKDFGHVLRTYNSGLVWLESEIRLGLADCETWSRN